MVHHGLTRRCNLCPSVNLILTRRRKVVVDEPAVVVVVVAVAVLALVALVVVVVVVVVVLRGRKRKLCGSVRVGMVHDGRRWEVGGVGIR